jgi:hypothetical protein
LPVSKWPSVKGNSSEKEQTLCLLWWWPLKAFDLVFVLIAVAFAVGEFSYL